MSEANNVYKALKDNPKEIVSWCEREIKEYKKLIELIKSNPDYDD